VAAEDVAPTTELGTKVETALAPPLPTEWAPTTEELSLDHLSLDDGMNSHCQNLLTIYQKTVAAEG